METMPMARHWVVPRNPPLQPPSVGSRLSLASGFTAAGPLALTLPSRSSLFKASEMLLAIATQGRFLGQVSHQCGHVPSWSPEGWFLLAHIPVPSVACLGRMAPALQDGEARLWMRGGDALQQTLCTRQESLVLPQGDMSA